MSQAGTGRASSGASSRRRDITTAPAASLVRCGRQSRGYASSAPPRCPRALEVGQPALTPLDQTPCPSPSWVCWFRPLQKLPSNARPFPDEGPYSIPVRGVESDVLPTYARHGMAVMSYSPLAGG
jgi:hypothetical protein